METLWLYLIALPIFLVIDMIWLVVVARGFYKRQLGELLATRPNWAAAVTFYLLYVLGIVVFASQPADNGWQALGLGALFGLVAYATYDLTNLATIRDWPVTLVAVDLMWGDSPFRNRRRHRVLDLLSAPHFGRRGASIWLC